MHAWEFYDDPGAEAATWAELMLEAFRELGVDGSAVAVDRLGAPAWLALQARRVTFVDAAPVTQSAREVKTPEEIRLLEINGEIVMEMLGAFESRLAPGVTERDLVATLANTMLRRGGEYLATNTVCSGPNTNPWRAEATDRAIDAGDLLYVDTDTVGVEGYFYCVSRAFVCGDVEPTAPQRDLYRAAHDWLRGMEAVIRPGITCAEAAALAPKIPERFLHQRYECMVHGIGLEEENPSVCHPQDTQSNGDRVIEPGMALVIELYCGEVGGAEGVKLGDEVLVTDDGIRVLAPYPFDDRLLGA
jgi:Xaa-Pro aminopeptidase